MAVIYDGFGLIGELSHSQVLYRIVYHCVTNHRISAGTPSGEEDCSSLGLILEFRKYIQASLMGPEVTQRARRVRSCL